MDVLASLSGEVVQAVNALLGSNPAFDGAAAKRLHLFGSVPQFDTRHKLCVAAASAIGAYALTIEKWWEMATGQRQSIGIDATQAACALNPGHFQRQSGYPMSAASLFTELKAGFYKTADERWFFPVGSYPHLRDGILDVLQCANSTEALSSAIGGWQGLDLEDAFGKNRLPGIFARTAQEWAVHPQGIVLAGWPIVEIEKIGESTPECPAGTHRPLDNVRVLDMGHVIAGPIVARSLAEHGADVLRASPPLMQDGFRQTVDTNIGKRSGFIDLGSEQDRAKMGHLIAGADVMVQSWRAGSLKGRGFGAEEAAAIRPGIIYVSVSCFGDRGPWATRGGCEQLGQAASGIAITEGYPDKPRLVPSGLLNDYLTGYLGAMGAMLAMLRRAEEGGSYHVKVALARTSMWVQSLGLCEPEAAMRGRKFGDDLHPLLESRESAFGLLEQLPPVAQFSRTNARWTLPPAPTGAHEMRWR